MTKGHHKSEYEIFIERNSFVAVRLAVTGGDALDDG